MINEGLAVEPERLNVLVGISLEEGRVNVTDEVILTNVASSIRRGHPQVRPQKPSHDRIALVGGGPSLDDTFDELKDLLQEGAKLVTVNGAYQWCLERNLTPQTQIVMDARASNARFLDPALPRCNYLLASQCAPESWDRVEGRPNVWIFHAAAGSDGPLKELLDAFYNKAWFGVGGGVTVITRALSVLRTLGYVRFDLFGVDCCFLRGQHHAYEQAENERDRPLPFDASPADAPHLTRRFYCAPWHAKQLECMLQMIRINGDHYQIAVHGDGLLAYALKTNADVVESATQGVSDVGSSLQDLQPREEEDRQHLTEPRVNRVPDDAAYVRE